MCSWETEEGINNIQYWYDVYEMCVVTHFIVQSSPALALMRVMHVRVLHLHHIQNEAKRNHSLGLTKCTFSSYLCFMPIRCAF